MSNIARPGLLFAPLAIFTLMSARPSTAAAADELECAPRVPTQIWSDSGSGGTHDVSIWRPTVGHSLGDLAVRGYGHTGELCGFIDRAAEGGAPALAPATAFIWRYDDHKTGANRSVSVWEPLCPGGFVAMGMVAAPSRLVELKCPVDQPCAENRLMVELDRFRCVRADLVRDIGGAPAFVWNDRKTGGKHDVSFWSRPGGAAQAGLENLTFFWGHRSHATPNPAALTTARRELKPGVVAVPGPVATFDAAQYFNIRLKGTNLYVAVERAGLGEFYTLIPDAADLRAQFHFRELGGRHEIVNRSSGGVMFAGEKVGAAPVEDTVHVHRTALVKGAAAPARSREWSLVRNGDRSEFRIVGTAAGAPVVWAAQPQAGARLMNPAQASAPANQSIFELFPATRAATPELRSGVFDPGLGDDRALRLGLAVAAGLVGAATKGAGTGLVNLVGIFALGNPNDAIAEALERLYTQVQIDIGQEIAAKSLTEAGNALLDATYELTVNYPSTLRDNISDPARLLALQNSAKDAARAFLPIRQRLTLERQAGRIAAKPANAFMIEGGLQVYATAAALHTTALQEAALIAAFDSVGGFDDELQTLDAEIERWITEYREMHDAQLTWRKDSVKVSTKLVPRGFKNFSVQMKLELRLVDKPLIVAPERAVGARVEDPFTGKLNATTPVENAIRDRYRAELDFSYAARYQPAELAANLRAVKAATAELCAKVRTPGSPERQAYLDSALAGRAPQGQGGVGVKSLGKGPSQAGVKPPRTRLKLVNAGGKFVWTIVRTQN